MLDVCGGECSVPDRSIAAKGSVSRGPTEPAKGKANRAVGRRCRRNSPRFFPHLQKTSG